MLAEGNTKSDSYHPDRIRTRTVAKSPHPACINTRRMNDFYYSGKDFGKISFDRFMKQSVLPSDCKTLGQRNPNGQLPFDVKPQVRPLSLNTNDMEDATYLRGRPDIKHAATSLAIPKVGQSFEFGKKVTDKKLFNQTLSSSNPHVSELLLNKGKSATCNVQVIEKNFRITVNHDDYLSREKTVGKISDVSMTGPQGRILKTVTRPTFMGLPEQPEPSKSTTRSVVSKFQGWLSLNESQNLTRKTAPEISKVPLSDNQKQQFKPDWMQKKIENDNMKEPLPSARNQFKKNARKPLVTEAAWSGCEKSIFNFGTHRHNLNTKLQFDTERQDHIPAKPFTAGPTAAGRATNSSYKIVDKPLDFYGFDFKVKPDFNRTLQTPGFKSTKMVQIKPYSLHGADM